MKTGTLKRLWGDCIEFMAYIRSNNANGHEYLNGKTHKTFVSSETAEISEFAEFGWYDWIMFRDITLSYPGIKPQLGCYCGLAYNIGSAMTAKILKDNG